MKRKNKSKCGSISFWLAICISVGIAAHTKAQEIPQNLVGSWKSEVTKITARKKTGFLRYQFKSCTVPVTIEIVSKDVISGNIGDAKFRNGSFSKNKGNEEVTGIAYIIDCGSVGRICSADSTGPKKLELWVKPLKHLGIFSAELRLKDGWDTFPMGEIVFTKLK